MRANPRRWLGGALAAALGFTAASGLAGALQLEAGEFLLEPGSLDEPAARLGHEAPELVLTAGASFDPTGFLRLPEPADSLDGPLGQPIESRGAWVSFLPWEAGRAEGRFAGNTTFFPLVGGALLLAWLLLTSRQPGDRRRR